MTTSPASTPLTVALIEAGYNDDRYLGWGYLNERRNADPALVAVADALVIRLANQERWTAEILFHWLNSKNGRWFADEIFGGSAFDNATLYRRYFAKVDFVPEAD